MDNVNVKRKAEIIVISDIHGWNDLKLTMKENVYFLDSRVLGEVNKDGDCHKEFIEGGIDKAAKELAKYKAKTVIGLSVGGVIAWRAVLKGMKVDNLIAISATRLRFETLKPKCNIELFFGEKDEFKPNSAWLRAIDVDYTIVPDGEHNIYKKAQFLNL